MEAQILASCLNSRDAFDVVVTLEAAQDLSPLGAQLLKQIETYYGKDSEASTVDEGVLMMALQAASPLQYEKLSVLVEGLPEPSEDNLIDALVAQRLNRIGSDMMQAVAANDQAALDNLTQERSEVRDMGLQGKGKVDALFDVYQGAHISELTDELREGEGFALLPGLLDKIVFNMMRGDHIAVFGMVNRGKSLVGIQMAGDFAYNGKKVLYIGNEDPAKRMLIRFVCNLCGVALTEVEEDEEGYTELAIENGYNNIIFKELAPGSVDDVRRLIDHFKPDVCVIDQARNIIPSGKASEGASKLEAIFSQLRMLYKKTKVIGVSVTQAGDKDASGKPLANKVRLEQNDIADSKYGVAANLDVMIGVGATESMVLNGQLYLNVCKNKASGIHDGVQGFIDIHTSSIKV
ncbi:MAG: AAA family ATPase [Gammaproteobacteria bacterium]|nr:AAA family ATPase [Gammaproteobacteria bacterium]